MFSFELLGGTGLVLLGLGLLTAFSMPLAWCVTSPMNA